MPTPEPNGAPRRAAFLEAPEPTPFWRSAEFARFSLLAFVALGLAGAFLYFQRAQERIATPPATASANPALPATATLTPEQRAEREAFLASAFEGALRDQADGARLQDTTGSRKLLEQISKFDAADFTARTQRTLEYAPVLADPDAWRGQFVRVSGVLGEIWAEKLARPVVGRESIWRGQLLSGEEFSEPTLLEFVDRPFPALTLHDLRHRAVEVEGVFYRTGTFDSEYVNGKGETVEATWTVPWVFVRNVRLIDEGQSPSHTFLNDHPMLVLGVLAFVIFGTRLLISWFQSRRRRQRRPQAQPSIRAMFDQKIREKGLPPAPPSPPKP